MNADPTARPQPLARYCRAFCLLAALIAFLQPAKAGAQQPPALSGDWSFGLDEGVAGASTVDAQGSRLGVACTEFCINFIESDRPCLENAHFEGTMTSTLGAVPIRVECHLLETGRYVLIFEPDQAFVSMIAASPSAVFSIRLEEGAPLKFSFSMRGAYDAISAMLQLAVQASEQASRAAQP